MARSHRQGGRFFTPCIVVVLTILISFQIGAYLKAHTLSPGYESGYEGGEAVLLLALQAERDAAVLRATKLESELVEARQSTCDESANRRASVLERELEDALSKQSDCNESPNENSTPEMNRLLDRIRDEQALRHDSEAKLASCTQQQQAMAMDTATPTLPGPTQEVSERIYRPDRTQCFANFPKRPEKKKYPRPTAFMTKGPCDLRFLFLRSCFLVCACALSVVYLPPSIRACLNKRIELAATKVGA